MSSYPLAAGRLLLASLLMLGITHTLALAAAADSDDAPALPLIDSPEVAQREQQAWAANLGRPVQWTNSVGMVMQLIPPGRFMMGQAAGGMGAGGDADAPLHEVTITEPFYIGATEVTRQQWQQVMGIERSTFFPGLRMPINFITIYDARAFLKALNTAEAEHVYALPTEAQWEYAARAGVATDFITGSDAASLEQAGWFLGNAGDTTHPVGQKLANAFGLFDVHGNVWEWCSDLYDPNAYRFDAAVDPQGPARSLYGYHVLRGGSIYFDANACRLGHRAYYQGSRSDKHIGFRVILNIPAHAPAQAPAAQP